MHRADSGEVKIADLGVSNEFDGADAFLTSTAGSDQCILIDEWIEDILEMMWLIC